MPYNPKIHHRRSVRLKGYDYAQPGRYFITICTENRECLFGQITQEAMILNETGRVADACWLAIPDHFPAVVLHYHIVMPNHVHGIIEITGAVRDGVGAEHLLPNFLPLQPQPSFQHPTPRSIGSIVKGFKTGVSKWYRERFGVQERSIWQRNYHEHIIREDASFQRISEYIRTNPARWNKDRFYTH